MGIGSLVCIINLLIAPVGNVLMRLGCQGKETEDFRWPCLSNPEQEVSLEMLSEEKVAPSFVRQNHFLKFERKVESMKT